MVYLVEFFVVMTDGLINVRSYALCALRMDTSA